MNSVTVHPELEDLRPGMNAEIERLEPIAREKLEAYLNLYGSFAELLEVLILIEQLNNRIEAETRLFGPQRKEGGV